MRPGALLICLCLASAAHAAEVHLGISLFQFAGAEMSAIVAPEAGVTFAPGGPFRVSVLGRAMLVQNIDRLALGDAYGYTTVDPAQFETMYALLKTDAEVLSRVPKGQEPPPPTLYEPERHRWHREGHYEPLKVSARQPKLTLLPNPSE